MTPSVPRIGVFGGTFDPIHTAHLELAEVVRVALRLDQMLLVVANRPWQKEGERPLTPAEDRFAMVEAAVAGWPGLVASRIEIDRGGPTYTIDTVRQLLADHPATEVVLVVGSDVVAGLPTWHDEAALSDLVTLAVVGRPGVAPAAGALGLAGRHRAGRAIRRVQHRAAPATWSRASRWRAWCPRQ